MAKGFWPRILIQNGFEPVISRNKILLGVLAGVLIVWLITPLLFTEFASTREKVVRAPVPADDGQLLVPIPVMASLARLQSPFAVIARIRNDGTEAVAIRVAADDYEICTVEVPVGASRRLDCTFRRPWDGGSPHTLRLLSASRSPRFTLEYLELATHFGALTAGPRNLIVGPVGFSALRSTGTGHLVLIFVLLTLSVWSFRDPRLPRGVRLIHTTLIAIVAVAIPVVVVSGRVSEYAFLIKDTFVERLLFVTALPMLVAAARSQWPLVRRVRSAPMTRPILVGVFVGAIFMSHAAHRADHFHQGNVSGLLMISHHFFDQSPMARDPDDIKTGLFFADGYGYDGQFYYYMTFDPFEVLRKRPVGFQGFIDAPPYRYGRIGFSLLTKFFSGDNPARYPITMVALVLIAVTACGILLALIAQHHGWRPWWGALILCIPGFWQSVSLTLPEPIAVALFLAAYLCVIRQKWWACGLLLGTAMMVRETGGALVLALTVGIFLRGMRRQAALVACLAFLPILVWKGLLAWAFWPGYGWAGAAPHPDDVGLPFAGVWQLWEILRQHKYFSGMPEMQRAAVLFPVLTTAAAGLAIVSAIKRPSPLAVAAVFYGLLTITFNYQSVWLHIGNAQRLTIDLFVALLLIFLQPVGRRVLVGPFIVFWALTAWYLCYGTYDAAFVRFNLFGGLL
jgi:hypothetical protein